MPGTTILGLSAYFHDSAAALVQDGKVVAAASEERFTRHKGDASFPSRAVAYCLSKARATVGELDAVGFYEKPIRRFGRLVESYLGVAPHGYKQFAVAGPMWINDKVWMDRNLREELGGYEGDVMYSEHHESHAASSFYPSPFDEAAILTMDGVGEWATTAFGEGQGTDIKLLREMRYPDSIGLLYSAFTYYLGFRINSGEYKVMGLAPYGEPKYAPVIYDELLDLRDDGSFRLNQEYFGFLTGLTMTNSRFDELFGGPPRASESEITQREMDIARSVQVVVEDITLRMARAVHRATRLTNLCLAGGVALNCVSNGRLLREGPFDRLWVQPASGDAGGALGVAQLIWHRRFGGKRTTSGTTDAMRGALLGPDFADDEVQAYLDEVGACYHRMDRERIISEAAGLIAQQSIIGWFRGRMEFGPRALGARSILGDPRNWELQDRLNSSVKFRESFRPFAPSVLQERAADFFELDVESPYMLLAARLRQQHRINVSEEQRRIRGVDMRNVRRSSFPAVTHVDYSARVQTVRRDVNPDYYDLIREFDRLTGCPLLLNTSFNVRGEPIVCTPKDAYTCFVRTDLDALVVGSFLLHKQEQDDWREVEDWRWHYELQ